MPNFVLWNYINTFARRHKIKTQVSEKMRPTWLWVLGWICIFPLPLTILLARKRNLNAVIKYGVITAAWIFYLIIAMAGNDNDNSEKTPDTRSVETTIQEESTDIVVNESEIENLKPVENSQVDVSTEIEKVTNTEIRNELLNGRGRADEGRSEPNYINVIGYAVISSSQEYIIEHTDNFEDANLWTVPTYEQDKQFWNETEITLPHKTEVVVKEQYLKHEGYGAYSGYLLVEKKADGQQYYIDVGNYITKPYWNYETEILKAALTGSFIAEYHQLSDYYPVSNNGSKVELEDGMHVLVTGVAGISRYVNPGETGIDAVVWKEWKNGYGGVKVHFNEEDLTIIF